MSKLSRYLCFSFGVIIAFSVVELILSYRTGMTHDTLTTCIFAFFGTEIGACAFIRIANGKRETQGNIADEEPSEWTDIEELEDTVG